ncbi:glycoside hydrolase [Rhizobium rhizogenes]|uniref:Lysozyme n=1 Tax=Rhizobium rhizogenes TaxID=359 RepID=A0AA88F7Y9_RHIRH|nr:lysozyme [Rhizobium rhizogenes]KAA3504349.1 glycoside hydrolase [Rhizobium rhizogenes]
MPINKITATKRGKAAIAAALLAAAGAGWTSLSTTSASNPPPAVILATDTLIKPWEGLVLEAHWDRFAKIWDICYGETNGVTAGMRKKKAECEDMLRRRVFNDYYLPLVRQIPGFISMPIGVQASMVSGAYNFGVAGMVNSRAASLHRQGRYREGCEAQTAWNKAGGQVVNGLVKRREMGDAQRAGEAEVCVSGLPQQGGAK